MPTLTFAQLAANAYRILGLPASATQSQIDLAARQLRIWKDPALIPPTAYDSPWLGPIPRDPIALEQAVSRLNEPQSRIIERLWWFCSTPPNPQIPLAPHDSIFAEHDHALRDLHTSLALDPSQRPAPVCSDIIHRFVRIAQDPDYRAWLQTTEIAGNFEKIATLEEIVDSSLNLPLSLAQTFATHLHATVDYSDEASSEAFMDFLLDLERIPALANVRVLADSIGTLEDSFRIHCEISAHDLHSQAPTHEGLAYSGFLHECLHKFELQARPQFRLLLQLTTEGSDRQERIRQQLVRVYTLFADYFEHASAITSAQRCLESAMIAAHTTAAEPRLRAALDQLNLRAGHTRLITFKNTEGNPILAQTRSGKSVVNIEKQLPPTDASNIAQKVVFTVFALFALVVLIGLFHSCAESISRNFSLVHPPRAAVYS